MKIKDNYGAESGELSTGYSNTGYIPEEGDNLGRLKEMEANEKSEEAYERKMQKMCGVDQEYDVGFLERQNTGDRI